MSEVAHDSPRDRVGEFRTVHRATPLLEFWTVLLALVAVFAANISGSLARDIVTAVQEGRIGSVWFLGGIGAFVAVCGAIWFVSGVWWRATGFRLDSEEVALKRGVISKALRTARYDRIQAVDVVEPVIARIFGVAKVRIETAGGGNSVLEIQFLNKREAEQVRAEVLSRAHRVEGSDEQNVSASEGPSGDVVIPPIPVRRSLIAAALNPASLILSGTVIVLALFPVAWGAIIPMLVGIVPAIWNIIDRSWQFTAVREGEVLNVSYGLADKRRQSIPLARIHAVQVDQPLLWRFADRGSSGSGSSNGGGWWRVQVSIAGYGVTKKSGGTTALLPVGSFEQALTMLELLSPLTGADIETVARPTGRSAAQFVSPRAARWVSPIDWRQHGTTLIDDRAIVTHSRRFGKRMAVISPAHVQELSYHRGPIGHALGLANVRLDLVPGPVGMSAKHLEAERAEQLLGLLRKRKAPVVGATSAEESS